MSSACTKFLEIHHEFAIRISLVLDKRTELGSNLSYFCWLPNSMSWIQISISFLLRGIFLSCYLVWTALWTDVRSNWWCANRNIAPQSRGEFGYRVASFGSAPDFMFILSSFCFCVCTFHYFGRFYDCSKSNLSFVCMLFCMYFSIYRLDQILSCSCNDFIVEFAPCKIFIFALNPPLKPGKYIQCMLGRQFYLDVLGWCLSSIIA